MRTGIVVFAHGSSVETANACVRVVSAEMARQGGYELVETAFLEQAPPDLAQAIATLVEKGAGEILVIPYFLTLGIHLQRDLPRIVQELSDIHNKVRIRVTPPLDGHPALTRALLDRAREALDG